MPAHLILEQLTEGLNESELQVLGQAAHIVVRLDGVAVLLARAGGWAGLDHVRVQGALHQELGPLADALLQVITEVLEHLWNVAGVMQV